jgi:NADPH:quinone reductase-like Zn-dependent oxidoreductase
MTMTAEPAAVKTMQAVVQDAYGTTDVLQQAEIAVPTPGPGEVLVQVRAAGMDRGTWHLMTGRPAMLRLALGFRRPRSRVPGLDMAGTVAALGDGVTQFAVGDEVFGIAKGSFAQYAVAVERKLASKPAGISFEQAAVVPISGGTAYQALQAAGLEPGDAAATTVLVTGASGGVGTYVVQIAAAYGAEVTGVASTAKLDLVRSLGAQHVIDYTTTPYADGTQQYDVIIDIAGCTPLRRLRRSLTRKGRVVLVGGEDASATITGGFGRSLRAPLMSLFVPQRLGMLVSKEGADHFVPVAELIEAGTVTPTVDRTYPLAEVREAMAQLEAGEVRGKVALTV